MDQLGKRKRRRQRLRPRSRVRPGVVVLACLILIFCCAMAGPVSPETENSSWDPFGRDNDPQDTRQPSDTEPPQTDDTDEPDGTDETDEAKDKNRDAEDEDDEPGDEQKPSDSGLAALLNNPAVVIAALCTIAVIVLAVLYIRAKKHSRPAPSRDRSTAPTSAARMGGAGTVAEAPRGIQAANIQGLGTRRNQQDSFGVTDVADAGRGVFAIVADGMGGIANGAEISQIATSYMLQAFKSSPPAQNPAVFLLGLVSGAQERARAFIERQGNQLSGSTVVAVIVRNGGLHFVSIGDSRIYLLRGGALIQLNREHTCASQLDEQAARGEISLEQARNDPQRNALTSYIGLDGQLQIDSNAQPIPIASGDRLLLMSDGVFGVMTEAELTQAAGMPNLYESAAAIERAVKVKQRPNQDNYTAILLAF